MSIQVGTTVERNDEYSNAVHIKIIQQLPDGTYLVHRSVDCPTNYKAEHPDKYLVMTEEEISEN